MRSARRDASTAGLGVSSTSFWWRRWTEQSRSPRWAAFAVRVGEDLDLNMVGILDVALDEEAVVAEGGGGLAARGFDRGGKVVCCVHDAHTDDHRLRHGP